MKTENGFLDYLFRTNLISRERLQFLKKSGLEPHPDGLIQDHSTEAEIGTLKSDYQGVKKVSLSSRGVDSRVALLIPEELAVKYTLIPFALQEGRLWVAMADPNNRKAYEEIVLCSGLQVEPFFASAEEIKIAIRECYTAKSLESWDEDLQEYSETMNIWRISESGGSNLEDGPIIRLVNSLFRQALLERASDIHWEPRENSLTIRFRIDGKLENKAVLSASMTRSVIARLKVMAGMDVTERRIPQDGRIVLDYSGQKKDIRVSTFNTVYGEKVVTRILDSDITNLSLTELGMSEEVERAVRKFLQHPHGLILVSGPTGSGKTTTLYTLLRELRSDSQNIVSIEDPVEYRLPGVNQAQVNARIGLGFAQGLRAILRQDPDIIMVGEIRDEETARIATAAALTGHLVLSTVHTNSAAEAVARMLDMGIEPYLVAASICGIIAQRLVRRLCPYCKVLEPVHPEIKKAFDFQTDYLYAPKGCDRCRGTGYKGRIGIHECLNYEERIKELVLKKSSALEIDRLSRELGIPSLLEDALLKVKKGWTSLEEVMALTAGV